VRWDGEVKAKLAMETGVQRVVRERTRRRSGGAVDVGAGIILFAWHVIQRLGIGAGLQVGEEVGALVMGPLIRKPKDAIVPHVQHFRLDQPPACRPNLSEIVVR